MKIKKKAPLKVSEIGSAAAARSGGVVAAVPVMAQTTAQAAAQSNQKVVTRVIGKETIPYQFHKEWNRALVRGDFEFIWDATHESGTLRTEYGPREEFQVTARRKLRPLKGTSPEAEFMRVRLNGHDEAHLLVVDGLQARERRDYTVERWVLLRGELGWRVMQIDVLKRSKDIAPKNVRVDEFPAFTLPEWFVAFRDARDAERAEQRAAEKAAREERRAMAAMLAGTPASAPEESAP